MIDTLQDNPGNIDHVLSRHGDGRVIEDIVTMTANLKTSLKPSKPYYLDARKIHGLGLG